MPTPITHLCFAFALLFVSVAECFLAVSTSIHAPRRISAFLTQPVCLCSCRGWSIAAWQITLEIKIPKKAYSLYSCNTLCKLYSIVSVCRWNLLIWTYIVMSQSPAVQLLNSCVTDLLDTVVLSFTSSIAIINNVTKRYILGNSCFLRTVSLGNELHLRGEWLSAYIRKASRWDL